MTPVIGQTISHYKILEHLGTGGMGTVYKAHDLKLNRPVALKFLSPELTLEPGAKARFFHEARASSSLQHKNVCIIYDIEESRESGIFISMEFLEGETLKKKIETGRIPVDEAVRSALQVAQGLARAHESGIIHRDIKPANIIVTEGGAAKILDFGVAVARQGDPPGPEGEVAGTTAYMSPEQFRGDPVDRTTDIWSLGVMLYELLTGKPPFTTEYHHATMYSVVHEKHRPVTELRPEVPAALENILNRCLEKDPHDRFPDAGSLVEHLKKAGRERKRPARNVIKSIAVLPFDDLSPDKDNRYFSDGLTDEIITKLSRLRNVRTISRTSVMNYERAGKPTKKIAAELGVFYLLEGSVRKHGSALRIATQLVDADRDTPLWAETYNGTMEEIFDIQEKVATRIAKALRLRVSPDEKRTLKRRATGNAEAYQLYLKGRFFWGKRSEEGLRKAIDFFEQAIAKDRRYAPAWAGMGDSYNFLNQFTSAPPADMYRKARAAVEQALEYDPGLAEAHASLGSLLMLSDWNFEGAENEFRQAIELNPHYATARHWYGELLSVRGRTEDAIREISLAASLEPLSPAILRDKGLVLYYAGDYDGAIDYGRKSLELEPTFCAAHRLLSIAYQGKGMFDRAIQENELWGSLAGVGLDSSVGLAQCYAAAGRRGQAEPLMEQILRSDPATGNLCRGIALVYAWMGEIDAAFAWLEKAFERRAESLILLKVDPKAAPLHSDPRYASLLKRVGLNQ